MNSAGKAAHFSSANLQSNDSCLRKHSLKYHSASPRSGKIRNVPTRVPVKGADHQHREESPKGKEISTAQHVGSIVCSLGSVNPNLSTAPCQGCTKLDRNTNSASRPAVPAQ